MRRLAILGASGHGKVVADTAELCGWDGCFFFDDQWPGKATNGAWPVIGNMGSLLRGLGGYDGVIVAIGDNVVRREKLRMLLAHSASVATVVHPTAVVSRYARIEMGTVVFANAVVNSNARVGMGAILNTSCSIDHDCRLADFVHVSPGAHLAGNVTVGEATWVGIGACIKQGITVGHDATVGAGSVVINDVADESCVAGVPAGVLHRVKNNA